MQVPVEWLREYVDFDESLEEVAARLTMAGLEVGEIVQERFGYENSFVGRVERVEKHPQRGDAWILTVAGGGLSRTVFTNLREFKTGEILPIAYEGFILPDGSKLEPLKFAGVLSDGKIIAEAEVGYSDNSEAILPLPETAKAGDCVPDAMDITRRVFKFDLTANRGDCLCVAGIARELAAVLGRPLKKHIFDFTLPAEPLDIRFSVDIKDPKLCPRYTGRVIRDVKITPSPVWMKRRLTACGMRPINSIVDVTNYVMLEAGQPLHAFDLDTLQDRAIIVRRAKKGEKITTIDGAARALDPFMLVIADSRVPVAVAGVMGGADTEISGRTVNMLLESAHFDPRNLRKTAMALDMRSEASLRFEKGVPLTNSAKASDYASFLIHKLGWGRPLEGMIDAYPKPHKPVTIKLSPAKVRNFISPAIPDEQMADILRRLEFDVQVPPRGKTLTVTAPGHRFDIAIWEDLAEEIARIYGYDKVPSELPLVRMRRAFVEKNMADSRTLREMLAACGLSEIYTFSFANMKELGLVWPENAPAAVPIKNPLTDDHTHLRPSLIPCMLKVIARNKANSPETPLLLFELGKIFFNPDRPAEKESLCIGVCGNALAVPARSEFNFRLPVFFVLKGIVDRFLGMAAPEAPRFKPCENTMYHPYRRSDIYVADKKIGELGELHPEVCARFDIREPAAIATFDIPTVKALLGREPRYTHISRLPALVRDLSVIVGEEVTAQDIEDVIRKRGTPLLADAAVFDVFRGAQAGEGKKSVTFALEFRSPDRTLTDEEVAPVMNDIVFYLKDELGGALREG